MQDLPVGRSSHAYYRKQACPISYPLLLPRSISLSYPSVHPEELWGEPRQLQRAAEETGDPAAGW